MNIQPTVDSRPLQGNPAVSSATRDVKTPGEASLRALKAVEPTQSPQAVQPTDRAKLEAATQSVREFVEPINSNLEFSVDHDTGETVVKIIDRATKEVIRQMPSEEMLAVAKALDSIKGLFVKQTA
ncbi:Flagellar protein FlaG protein [Candidatus Accumulibacter aalborgensis]|uniref:Flagellar protein FlaG protein n=1 Tax=Candidatus Accumulibacter aalborgensis TaxID=1860102 RepID=A0A1A8XGA1_9PROT|nr:flagellar protein FlaG [Candidatus Accumulibacter aalborgensis]SBT04209.1 Flagellar protein FlaG protein [Candidatus Accumulibacter aalborgensis]